MSAIGIDIGTTTICGVAIDEDTGQKKQSVTLPNDSNFVGRHGREKLQDTGRILEICLKVKKELEKTSGKARFIGISGQMHGIIYLDSRGEAISPLYSWQDLRGNESYNSDQTYSEYMSDKTGYRMASGFGLTTHFYHLVNNMAPDNAAAICTIGDFIAMKLAGLKRPVMHKSMAASLGLFDVERGCFDEEALNKLNIDAAILPQVSQKDICLGGQEDAVKVSAAIGDNQASCLGAMNRKSNLVVNIGTGSQVSVFSEKYVKKSEVEIRPYIDNHFLMVGSPLCGGAAYELLKNFFAETVRMFSGEIKENIYDIMNLAAKRAYMDGNPLLVSTKFKGTRLNPKERGSISLIGIDNFTPGHFAAGILEGICDELFQIYKKMPVEEKADSVIIGSGNGIRKNKTLQQILADKFGKEVRIPLFEEEASYGAALYALFAGGYIGKSEELREMVQLRRM